MEPTKTWVQQIGKQFSTTSTSEHAVVAGNAHRTYPYFPSNLSNIRSRYPITTTVQP
jgi:hypothetical protein